MTHYRSADVTATEGRPITAVLATSTRQADGLALNLAGCRMARFTRNPVILLGHDHRELPIGRVSDVRVDGARMIGRLNFAQGDPVASRVENLVRQGVLNSVSIGFDLVSEPDRDGNVAAWSLNEVSMVPVPMDQDALVLSRAHATADATAIRELLAAFDVPTRVDAKARKRLLDAFGHR